MEAIIKNLPATTPVAILNLGKNKLTQIPANLPQYTQLQTLIASSNVITEVKANEVTLPAKVTFLDLSSNKITRIAAASLPGRNIFSYFISYSKLMQTWVVKY